MRAAVEKYGLTVKSRIKEFSVLLEKRNSEGKRNIRAFLLSFSDNNFSMQFNEKHCNFYGKTSFEVLVFFLVYQSEILFQLDTILGGDFDMNEFEAAKRSLVCELIEAEDTVKTATTQAILAQFRGLGPDHTRLIFWKFRGPVNDLAALCAHMYKAS